MISRERLEVEIRELEEAPVNLRNCRDLQMLKSLHTMYYCENEPTAEPKQSRYYMGDTVPKVSESDFMNALEGVEAYKAWELMDELMGTLSLLDSKTYKRVMKRIEDIR